jgi:Kef-type K+ transport system membrane component KefB
MVNLVFDIAAIIVITTIIAFIARLLRQPLIPAYIIGGLILGPAGLSLINDAYNIHLMAEIGIAFMLFIVGLELDFGRLRDVGMVASVGGMIKSMVLFGIGFFIAYLFGIFTLTESFYIGLIIAFSSTMVVVKLLSDMKSLDSLHARIIIGILLIEDILAIFVLSALAQVGNFNTMFFVISIVKAAGILFVAVFLNKYVFPTVFKYAAKSQELLLPT